MTELVIDTKAQTIRLRLELVVETEPVEIHVTKYRLERRGEDATMTVFDATASRPWLTEVLRQFVVGRAFTIPPAAAAALKLLA